MITEKENFRLLLAKHKPKGIASILFIPFITKPELMISKLKAWCTHEELEILSKELAILFLGRTFPRKDPTDEELEEAWAAYWKVWGKDFKILNATVIEESKESKEVSKQKDKSVNPMKKDEKSKSLLTTKKDI